MDSDFDDFLGSFDSALEAFDSMLRSDGTCAVNRLPNILVSSAFPPTNMYENADGGMVLEFAIAGYKREEVSIQFEDDYLKLSMNPEKSQDDGKKYLQHGIKSCKTESKYFIPAIKYDVSKAVANLKDGILSINIPVREDAKPRDIKIDIA